MITRRQTLQLLGTAAVTAFLATSLPAMAQNVAVQDLAVQGPLGDVALGPENAKVTIIEYASLTCSHCANFHKNTMKALADFIGSCGCENLADLRPEMFYKRTQTNENRDFSELYGIGKDKDQSREKPFAFAHN